jgi:hypothetical protein
MAAANGGENGVVVMDGNNENNVISSAYGVSDERNQYQVAGSQRGIASAPSKNVRRAAAAHRGIEINGQVSYRKMK